jgi:hypothetical protein
MRPQVAREIAHLIEIGDAALIDPLKDLSCVKSRVPEICERGFELVQVGLGDVDASDGRHVRPAGWCRPNAKG